MKRRLIGASLLVVLVVALLWLAPWAGTESSTYTVEVVPADEDYPGDAVAFAELNASQREQFERTITTERTYESPPVLLEYAGDEIEYEGETYVVIIAVP